MDIAYLLWLQELRSMTGGIFDGLLEGISDLVISVYAYLFLAFVYWCVDKRAGIMAAMNIGIGNAVNQLVKNIFCVYRPWIRSSEIIPAGNAIATAGGYSFPSSHTQVAVAGFGSVAIWQKKKKGIVVFCIGMILLVMFSRNYLGVHTPQDVVGSLLLCSIVMALDYRLIDWLDKNPERDIPVFLIGMLLCAAALVFMTIKPYPLDYAADGSVLVNPAKMIAEGYTGAGCAMGFLTGWILERRFVNFEVPETGTEKGITFLLGVGFLLVLAGVVCEPLKEMLKAMGDMGYCFSRLMYFFIIYVYIMAGFPCLIKWMKKRKKI